MVDDGGNKTSLLVVDDEAPITELICEALVHEGFDCDRAQSGPEALDIKHPAIECLAHLGSFAFGTERRAALRRSSSSVKTPFAQSLAVSFERRFRMGTKPMVFPLDADGRVYALHNENDEQLCTGSRETCYRLLALMLEVKRRTDECQPEATELIKTLEHPPKAASAASSS